AHTILRFEPARRECGLIHERQYPAVPLMQRANAKSHQDSLLYPRIHMPLPIALLGGTYVTMRQSLAEALESCMCLWDFVSVRSCIKQCFNLFPQACDGK